MNPVIDEGMEALLLVGCLTLCKRLSSRIVLDVQGLALVFVNDSET